MNTTSYDHILRPGESVMMQPPKHGSQEWAYDCNFAAVDGNTHELGNSVIIDVEPGGATEPVLIRSDITLTISVLEGWGRIILWNGELGDRVVQAKLNRGDAPVVLFQGDVYYYLNDGPGNLILRDDSRPAFIDGDEVLLTAVPKPGQKDGRRVKLPVTFWSGFASRKY